MKSELIRRFWTTVAVVLAFLHGVASVANADTSLLRELAKNRPRILIVVSGPGARPLGERLQKAILDQPDNRHKPTDAPVLSFDEAEKTLSSSPLMVVSAIWLLSRDEWDGKLPPAQTALVTIRPADVKPTDGAVDCTLTSKGSKGTAFSITAIAPNRKRLESLVEKIEACEGDKFENLDFLSRFETHNVAVFSHPDDRGFTEKWNARSGPQIWSEQRWYPLSERDRLSPDELRDFHEVYFIDRSRGAPAPTEASKLPEGVSLRETTLCALVSEKAPGLKSLLFSAPSNSLLKARAAAFDSFEAVPSGRFVQDVADLRRLGKSALFISGRGPDSEERVLLRGQLAQSLQEHLKLPVADLADILHSLPRDFGLADLRAGGDSAAVLQSEQTNFVWQLAISDWTGKTSFDTRERLIEEGKPEKYDVDPPVKPTYKSVGGGLKEEKERRKPEFDQYERDYKRWLEKKAAFEERAKERVTSIWRREVLRSYSAKVRGKLRLVDISDAGRQPEVVWETEINGSVTSDPEVHQQDRATVRGLGSRPSSITPPENRDDCPPGPFRDAALRAIHSAVQNLRLTAWLPDPD